MRKKLVSGQSVAIIILIILLLSTIGFGVVFAYFKTKATDETGKIVMANLNINFVDENGTSGQSNIVFTDVPNLVAGQELKNTALLVNNSSEAPIYLIVVYKVKATKYVDGELQEIQDPMTYRIFDNSFEYYNSLDDKWSVTQTDSSDRTNSKFVDYVFSTEQNGQREVYRCYVCTEAFPIPISQSYSTITVIEKNQLKLAKEMGNDYMGATISFQFQAFAVNANPNNIPIKNNDSESEKCNKIVSYVYKNMGQKFLTI